MPDNAPKSEASAAASVASELESLRANQIEWGRAWETRDLDGILSHYAPDALLLVPGKPPVRGVSAFAPFIEAVLKRKTFLLSWTVDQADVSSTADLGYVQGSYVQHNPIPDTDRFTVETGSYVTVLRKTGNRWLALAEINTPHTTKALG